MFPQCRQMKHHKQQLTQLPSLLAPIPSQIMVRLIDDHIPTFDISSISISPKYFALAIALQKQRFTQLIVYFLCVDKYQQKT